MKKESPQEASTWTNIIKIDEHCLSKSEDLIILTAPAPLQVLSSGVIGAGFMGDKKFFVNRYVGKNYDCLDHRNEMKQFLKSNGIHPQQTVGMMTAVKPENVVYQSMIGTGFSIFIVVTAGISNAIDVTKGNQHSHKIKIGTINTWVFVNGIVTDEAFVQSVITATEAKTKALQKLQIKDHQTGTNATGTSTDSIAIAATQSGKLLDYAGPITELGSKIGLGVYHCTKAAIEKNCGKRQI